MDGGAASQGDMRELMLALKRARDDADRRAAETSMILEVLETLLRPLPPARLVLRVLRVVRRFLPFDDAVVLEADRPRGLRVAFATESWRLGAAWPDGAVFARARRGEVVNLVDVARVPDLASVDDPLVRRPGGALVIALPVEGAGFEAQAGEAPLVLLRAAEIGGFTAEMVRTVRRLTVVARQALLSLEARQLRLDTASLAAEKAASDVALEESERREAAVRGLLDAIPVGIYLKDETGRFAYVNGATERITGVAKEDLLGRLPSEVLPPEIGASKEADDHALLTGAIAGPVLREMALGQPATASHVEINKAAVTLEGRRLVVATMQDVTLRRAAEAAMVAAKDAAEAANRAKTEFIATVSHEIRTPLNGILGMTQALLAQPRGAEDRRALNLIRTSGDLLLGLVDNILNVAKIEARKLDLLPAEIDLAMAVHQVAALWAEKAHAKGLDLVRLMDGDLPMRVRVDPLRLSQVLNNLMGNAVKFTVTGGVALRLWIEGDAEARHWLDVVVEDTGPGIPAAARDRLFRRFSQIEAPDERGRPGGTGLGLSICQDLVRLMGGEITHADRPDGGSVFRFRIPVEVTGAAPRFGLPLRGMRALVPPAQGIGARHAALARDTLASMGAELLETPPGPGGLPPDLMVCVEGGGAGMAALRGVPRIMIASAEGAAARSGEARGILIPPLGPTTLYDAVGECLGIAQPARPLIEDADAPADRAAPRHRRNALVLVTEDNDVNQAVARALLEGLGLRVAIAGDGQAALDFAARLAPDLVLMDLQMPGMDGLEATRALRATGLAAPIVACTANVLPETLATVRLAGAAHVLRKPINRKELVELLAQLLPASGAAAPVPRTMPPRTTPIVRPSMLAELVEAIGAEAVTEAATLFRASARERVAFTMQALASGDLGAASRHAHALKSPAAMLGAETLAQVMTAIERASLARDRAGAEAAAAGLPPLLEDSLVELDRALAQAA